MKKYLFSTIGILGLTLIIGGTVFAQGMISSPSSSTDNATIQSQQQEEQEGKKLLGDLGNKTIVCSQLKDADFEKIGEYFMGQAIGNVSRHIAMNKMMKGMMGEQEEEQMHIAWGKRGSGCDTSSQGTGFMPMLQMMMGNSRNSMMGNWSQNQVSLLWLVWLIVGILAVVWLWKQIIKK